MMECEKEDEKVDFDLLDPPEKIMSAQLQNILIQLCDGPAARIVHRAEDDFDNGFESWRLLYKRYAPLKRAKATNRLTKIINWTFKEHDLETSFNEWEAEIFRYESDAKTPINDDIKIGILVGKIRGSLQEHLIFHTDVSMTYANVRSIVINYFKTGQLFRGLRKNQASPTAAPSSGSSSMPTPMEIDAIWRRIKGKGK